MRHMGQQWHAIRAKAGAEGKALIGVGAIRLRGYMPVELLRIVHRSERWTIWRPLFPRYLFAQLDPGRDMTRLREIDGVLSVLRAPIQEAAIDAVRAAEEAGVFNRSQGHYGLREGDTVRIIDGPFAGLVAQIKSARPRHRMQVLVDFAHRITLPIDKLQKVGT